MVLKRPYPVPHHPEGSLAKSAGKSGSAEGTAGRGSVSLFLLQESGLSAVDPAIPFFPPLFQNYPWHFWEIVDFSILWSP